MANAFVDDARDLAKMLNAVADQAEKSGDNGLLYCAESYPAMVNQIGKVLVDLGHAKLHVKGVDRAI
jgi:hypothetical protein